MPQLNETQQARLEELRTLKSELITKRESVSAKRGIIQEAILAIDDVWGNYDNIINENEISNPTHGDTFFSLTNPQFFAVTNNSIDRTDVWIRKQWYVWRIDKGYPKDEARTSNEKLRDCLDSVSRGYSFTDLHPYPDKSQVWYISDTMEKESVWSGAGWVTAKMVEYTRQLKKLINQRRGDLDQQYILDH